MEKREVVRRAGKGGFGMSDTPETDEQSPWRYSIKTPNGVTTHFVPADFARKLERERDRYKSDVEVITKERDQWRIQYEQAERVLQKLRLNTEDTK